MPFLLRSLPLLLAVLSVSALATDFTKLYQKVDPTVVVIHTLEGAAEVKDAEISGIGSGVIISTQGDILTAAHVVSRADIVLVELGDGKKIRARVMSSMVPADLALIRLQEVPHKLPVAKLGESDAVKTGEEVVVIGAPYGLEHTLTTGHVSGRRLLETDFALEPIEFLQTDAAINQGNSGGPMFNMQGEVIGVVSHILSESGGSQGMGFAVTSATVRKLILDQPPIWFGVDIYVVAGELAQALNVPQDMGFLVQNVAIDSLGDRLGLREGTVPVVFGDDTVMLGGDVMLAVGPLTIRNSTTLLQDIRQYYDSVKPGQPVQLTVLRAGRVQTLTAPKQKDARQR
jgi:serine protease Do